MKVGIISVYVDYHRRGRKNRLSIQPQAGALIAGLLPAGVEVEVINDAWRDPDWSRNYDLLLISCLHSDFDRARQISHYWRRRGKHGAADHCRFQASRAAAPLRRKVI